MRTRTTPGRALPVLGAAVLLVLALAGCLKIDSNLTIEGDTVSGTLLTVLDKAAAAQLELNPADVFASENDRLASLDGVSTEPFDDGTWEGTELTFDQVALDDLNQLSDGDPDGLRIVRDQEAGTYEFHLVMDLAFMSQLSEEQAPPDSEVDLAALLETFDARVAVTFPGEVTEHSGELSGTTVTWVAEPGERTELRAVAQDAGGGDPGAGSDEPDASAAPGEATGAPGEPGDPGEAELTSGTGDGSSTVPLIVGVALAAVLAAAAAGWWFFLRPRRAQPAEAGTGSADSGDEATEPGNQPAEPDVE